jgi:uncharacterized protein (TIGR03435 family)
MKHRIVVLFGLALGALWGQALQFEVASVRPSAKGDEKQVNLGLHLDGTQAQINALTMRDYIGMAYELRPNKILGPDWLGIERFDIRATLPAGAKTKQIPEMLRGLLADRFGLRFHKEQKEFQVYVLALGKRPLALKPTNEKDIANPSDVNVAVSGSSAGVAVDLGGGASYTFANNKFEGRKLNMATLVDSLETYMNLPVVDETKLNGFYDVSLELANEDYRAMLLRAAMASGIALPPQAQQFADTATTPSLFDAIDKLGLRLETRRMPMEVLVVDEIRRTPTEN